MDLQHEANLQVSLLLLIRWFGLWARVLVVGCHGCVAATCEHALELLLADHFVRVPVHNVDGNAIDVLKEHVPVLVLRGVVS